jgi:DUF1365 family protein
MAAVRHAPMNNDAFAIDADNASAVSWLMRAFASRRWRLAMDHRRTVGDLIIVGAFTS